MTIHSFARRSFSPYKWRTDLKIPEYNYKRVAAVWMDEYKDLYLDRLGLTAASQVIIGVARGGWVGGEGVSGWTSTRIST